MVFTERYWKRERERGGGGGGGGEREREILKNISMRLSSFTEKVHLRHCMFNTAFSGFIMITVKRC